MPDDDQDARRFRRAAHAKLKPNGVHLTMPAEAELVALKLTVAEAAQRIDTVREAILSYDAADDTRGDVWDGLRIKFDLAMRSAVNLLELASR